IGEKSAVSLILSQVSTRINPTIEGDHARFDIQVRNSAKIVENTSLIDLSEPENLSELRSGIKTLIKREIREAIHRMQQHGSDSAGFGLHLARAEPRKWRDHYQMRWHEALKEADFHIAVETKITDIGLTTGN